MIHLLLAIIYLAFISLGLPDALLGSAWPTMYLQFSVPVSYMGGISMIIAAGTIISSLQCDRLTKKLGTGKVTAISVCMTAAALLGFRGVEFVSLLGIFASPTAINSFTMAQQMGGDEELAGDIVIVTSAASAFTFCGWIFLFKSLGIF